MSNYYLDKKSPKALAQGEKCDIIEVDRDHNRGIEDMDSIKLLGLDQVKDYLGIGHGHLYKLINSNKLRTVKIGSRRLVSMRTLREFVAQLESNSKENGNYG